MESKVTIVIPVYNVENYMDKCIQSVLSQTLREIEVILVDDGSTDSSGKKCDQYIEIDDRIRVIHQKNQGLSAARNTGIDAAASKYIGFVDSDDYIKETMFEVLYNSIVKFDADVAICGMYDCYADRISSAYKYTEGQLVTDGKDAIKYAMEGSYTGLCAVTKLYKKDNLMKNYFKVGKTFEDAHFTIPYLCDVKKTVFELEPQYYYVHREDSITTKPFQKSDLSIIEAYTNNRNIINDKFPSLKECADFRYYWSHFYVLDKIMKSNTENVDKIKEKIITELKKNYMNIIKNSYIGKGRKIAMTGLMLDENIYKALMLKYSKTKKKLFKESTK